MCCSGLAEALSFNVTSLLPPTPIPPNSTLRRPAPRGNPPGVTAVGGGKRKSKRQKVAEVGRDHAEMAGQRKPVDILMTSPDAEYVLC